MLCESEINQSSAVSTVKGDRMGSPVLLLVVLSDRLLSSFGCTVCQTAVSSFGCTICQSAVPCFSCTVCQIAVSCFSCTVRSIAVSCIGCTVYKTAVPCFGYTVCQTAVSSFGSTVCQTAVHSSLETILPLVCFLPFAHLPSFIGYLFNPSSLELLYLMFIIRMPIRSFPSTLWRAWCGLLKPQSLSAWLLWQ